MLLAYFGSFSRGRLFVLEYIVMKIAFFEAEGWEEAIIKTVLPEAEVWCAPTPLDSNHLPGMRDFDIVSVFVGSRLTADVFAAFPKMRLVATRSTGFDHVDAVAAKERGVAVSYVPGYGDNTVAEFAFGLILNLTRKLYQAIDRVKETGSFSFEGLRGVDLKGKTLGVFGTGRIGREVVRIAKGFGMEVVAYDVFQNAEAAGSLGFSYVGFDDVLKRSDVITLHCPYMKETHHMINMSNIGLVKKDTYLVNTARGGLVETGALVYGLEEGILAGVGLDVLEDEEEMKAQAWSALAGTDKDSLRVLAENNILRMMPNVLITPHVAFNSVEAVRRILDSTLQSIRGFSEGKPVNLVP